MQIKIFRGIFLKASNYKIEISTIYPEYMSFLILFLLSSFSSCYLNWPLILIILYLSEIRISEEVKKKRSGKILKKKFNNYITLIGVDDDEKDDDVSIYERVKK